jgi:hypothetical protein
MKGGGGGPSLAEFVGFVVLVQEIFVPHWLLRPSTNYFFPHCTLFHCIFSSSPRKLGRQSCRVTSLLICDSGSATFQDNFIPPIGEERQQSICDLQ